jgi:16S rRNA (adenine1518-N6/adenine1519-N6)-dimethyltransferase
MPPTKKSLGQHWLTDLSALEAIVASAQLQPTDTVLEIGPGPGSLTKLLVDAARQVVAVEFDQPLARQLPKNVPAGNLQVVNQDILTFDLNSLPPGYKVVANIPYFLTSNLIRVLSELANPPLTVVLLIQKEVAERVAAKPGAMSLLSVSAQLYYSTELGPKVPAALFTPPPKVDSQVLIMRRHPQPLFPGLDYKAFMRVVKAGFAARRKTLLNSLSGGLRLPKDQTGQFLTAAGLPPGARPQELNLDQWQRLTQAILKNT